MKDELGICLPWVGSLEAVKAENLPQRSRRLASHWGGGCHRSLRPSMATVAGQVHQHGLGSSLESKQGVTAV
jgi:hypothetical protein